MSQAVLTVATESIPGNKVLAAINGLSAALATWWCGPLAPTTASNSTGLASLAGIVWHDTTANMLKVRDQADSAWITVGTFDETAKLFRAAASAQPVTAIAANQAITAASHGVNLVATAALTLTLPQASSIANGACAFSVLAEGGAVTLTPNAADSIVIGSTAQAAAASYVLAQGSSALVVCDGAGKWYLLYLEQQQSSGLPIPTGVGGTADALTATYSPSITALTNGMTLLTRAAAANATATPTFTPASGVIAAKAIVKGAGAALVPGDIAGAGHWLLLTYDAALDKWVLGNPAGVRPTKTWRNVTANRASGTTYYNTTSRTMDVVVSISVYVNNTFYYAYVNGGFVVTYGQAYASGYSITFSVPPGQSYEFVTTAGISAWTECSV